MNKAIDAQRFPLWKRSCEIIDDVRFARHGLLRCISSVHSGRHYLQVTDEIYDETICHSSYFNALKSPRRMNMVKAIEKQSYGLQSEILSSLGVDYLKQFSELDEYRVQAADGHFIQHACHTKKNSKGKVFAAGFIHALNLRNGLLRPLCVVTSSTNRHQEIPALRTFIEQRHGKKETWQKHLYVYDKAVTDFSWWDKQKQDQNFMISVLKENAVITFVESIEFDQNDEVNTGVESYSVYENKKAKFHVVQYRDPETDKLHKFISTLPKSINPGTIAMIYYKRWTIEKSFNNSKSDLNENKAWSSNLNALNSQMRFTAMAYNIMRVFEETSKANSPECIHPSDKKYDEALDKRQKIAQDKGRFVNPLFFHARIARICSFTFRSIQNAIMTGKLIIAIMDSLVRHLRPRVAEISEH
ncbi:MAG: transposase [Proteobacteria bacterium]|nr:transposase [Pseudomonadota bacterium]